MESSHAFSLLGHPWHPGLVCMGILPSLVHSPFRWQGQGDGQLRSGFVEDTERRNSPNVEEGSLTVYLSALKPTWWIKVGCDPSVHRWFQCCLRVFWVKKLIPPGLTPSHWHHTSGDKASSNCCALSPRCQQYFCRALPKRELSNFGSTCAYTALNYRFQLHRPQITGGGPQMLASGTNQNFLTSACFSVSFQPQEFLPLRIFIVTIAAILLIPAISSILFYSRL